MEELSAAEGEPVSGALQASPPVGGPVRIVDLTVVLDEDLPCTSPENIRIKHKVYNWPAARADGPVAGRSRGPHYTAWLVLDEHTGTHFDAPSHFAPQADLEAGTVLPDEMFGDMVPLARLQGPAVVVDATGLRHAGPSVEIPVIDVEFALRWEGQHGRIEAGSVVLLMTGWDVRYRAGAAGDRYARDYVLRGARPGWPAPSPDLIALLHEREVRTIGTDAPSMGPVENASTVHYAGLGRGMAFVEALTNLGALPTRGAFFVFAPLKIARSSAGPARRCLRPRRGAHS